MRLWQLPCLMTGTYENNGIGDLIKQIMGTIFIENSPLVVSLLFYISTA